MLALKQIHTSHTVSYWASIASFTLTTTASIHTITCSSNAKHNLSIPVEDELPLLWMPPTAGFLLKSVEEQMNWVNSRALWGGGLFAVAIGSLLIASFGLFVTYYRSLRVQRRIQSIDARLAQAFLPATGVGAGEA